MHRPSFFAQNPDRKNRLGKVRRVGTIEALEPRTLLTQFIVNTTIDSDTVGTLRWALNEANKAPDLDQIHFDIESGPQTITLASGLPTITAPVEINARTQPGFELSPLIELDGSGVSDASGFVIETDGGGTTISGFTINRFPLNGIHIVNSSGNKITGNYIGTNASGDERSGNAEAGVRVQQVAANLNDASMNTIGGIREIDRNVISGNDIWGVLIADGAKRNFVQGNYIGTDKTGTKGIGNLRLGVDISRSSNNTVGGNVQGAGNLISGNGEAGVIISGAFQEGTQQNTVAGNTIGLDVSQTTAIPNFRGVQIDAGAHHNIVGTDGDGNGDEFEENIISGNNESGVLLLDAETKFNSIAGNQIGVSKNAIASNVGNIGDGVYIVAQAASNTVGGIGVSRNIISGNGAHGVRLESASGNFVGNNLIGTNATSNRLPNGIDGIHLLDATGNKIGVVEVNGEPSPAGNVVAGNVRGGIGVYSGSTGNTIQGNDVGINAVGQPEPNGNGIVIQDSDDNTVGALGDSARNWIAGNTREGILLRNADENTIQNNYIGNVFADGSTDDFENGTTGIMIDSGSQENLIGGPAATDRNVISGNGGIGIYAFQNSGSGNEVVGNFIGTDFTGRFEKPNEQGINVQQSPNNRIFDNLISGNDHDGIILSGASTSNTQVIRNTLGLDVNSTEQGNGSNPMVLPNGAGVTVVDAPSNTIHDNVISANEEAGIRLRGGGTRNNSVTANVVGHDGLLGKSYGNGVGIIFDDGAMENTVGGMQPADANAISGNQEQGILFHDNRGLMNFVTGNFIGTDRTGTLIRGNGAAGITIFNSVGATIESNTVSGNGKSGFEISGRLSTQNSVVDNFIGTNETNSTIPNNGNGVIVLNEAALNQVKDNTIRSNTGDGIQLQSGFTTAISNDIVGNGGAGIAIHVGIGNELQRNTFSQNGGRAVDLSSDGRTLNDEGDVDDGPNGLQNFPGSVGVTPPVGGVARFRSSLDVSQESNFPIVLDFYRADAVGEIVEWLGQKSINTLEDIKDGLIDQFTTTATSFGNFVVATATDDLGNTSEFSDVPLLPNVKPLAAADSQEPDGPTDQMLPIPLVPNQPFLSKDRNIHDFGDRDYFLITVPAETGNKLSSGTLVITLKYDQTIGDLDLEVLDANQKLIVESSNRSGTERLAFPVVADQLNVTGEEVRLIVAVKGFLDDVHSDNYEIKIELDATDQDADGLPDEWERNGEVDGIKLSNVVPNPDMRRDVYLEYDYVKGFAPAPLDEELRDYIRGIYPRMEPLLAATEPAGNNLLTQAGVEPTGTVLDLVVASFLLAPVENLLTDQPGIRLHLQESDEITEFDGKFDSWDEFLEQRDRYFGTVEERQPDQNGNPSKEWLDNGSLAKRNVYRYAFFGKELAGSNVRGRASIGSNDFVLTVGDAEGLDENARALHQAGVFMHELGHTFGLQHGGGDTVANKPNYISVMNDAWVVPRPHLVQGWTLDYSRFTLPTLNRRNLAAHGGIACYTEPTTEPIPDPAELQAVYENVLVPIGPPVDGAQARLHQVDPLDCSTDWSGNGLPIMERDLTRLLLDANEDGQVDENDSFVGDEDELVGFNDWSNLQFRYTYSDLIDQGDAPYGGEGWQRPPDYEAEANDSEGTASAVGEIWDFLRSLLNPGGQRSPASIDPEQLVDEDWLEIPEVPVQGIVDVTFTAKSHLFNAGFEACLHSGDGEPACQEVVVGGSGAFFSLDVGPNRTSLLSIQGREVVGTDLFDAGNYETNLKFRTQDGGELAYVSGLVSRNINDIRFDLNGDDVFDNQDRDLLIQKAYQTTYGDVDLNGEFGRSDFLAIASNFGKPGTWKQGDLNGDTAVDLSDLKIWKREIDRRNITPDLRDRYCDVNGTQGCGIPDIDALTHALRSNEYHPTFDLNLDFILDVRDREILLGTEDQTKLHLETPTSTAASRSQTS